MKACLRFPLVHKATNESMEPVQKERVYLVWRGMGNRNRALEQDFPMNTNKLI